MKKILYSAALISILSAGCKKSFLDINVSPNSPTEGSIAPNLILPQAMVTTASRMGTTYGWTANWIGYWAPSGTYAPDAVETTYNITTAFQSGQWTGWYNNLNDLVIAERKAKAANQNFYEGMAILMQVPGWMSLVDMYNNIPYSEAFKLEQTLTPKYDDAQAIYNDLVSRITYASDKIKNAAGEVDPILVSADVMFRGNVTMWLKFANTLKLKLAIHQSQVPGFSPASILSTVTADGYLGAGETAAVGPVPVANSLNGNFIVSNGKLNPFWNSYKSDYAGVATNEFYRANNYVLNMLKDNNDVRYNRYFSLSTTNGVYAGVTYGSPPDESYNAGRTSNVSGPGLAVSNIQPQWVLTSVESMFLQAEAIARNWIPGDAKTAYENAVKESFTYLSVPDAATQANVYLAQQTVSSTPHPVSNWEFVASGTTTQKVAFIAMQKYLSLVGINNLEAWTDYRRLNVPSNIPISVNPARISNTIPIRLLYSSTEYSYNQANVSAQGSINQFTSPIFWDR